MQQWENLLKYKTNLVGGGDDAYEPPGPDNV